MFSHFVLINAYAFLPVHVNACIICMVYRSKNILQKHIHSLGIHELKISLSHAHTKVHTIEHMIYSICQIVASAVERYPRKNYIITMMKMA